MTDDLQSAAEQPETQETEIQEPEIQETAPARPYLIPLSADGLPPLKGTIDCDCFLVVTDDKGEPTVHKGDWLFVSKTREPLLGSLVILDLPRPDGQGWYRRARWADSEADLEEIKACDSIFGVVTAIGTSDLDSPADQGISTHAPSASPEPGNERNADLRKRPGRRLRGH
jgi:hypothetical protein